MHYLVLMDPRDVQDSVTQCILSVHLQSWGSSEQSLGCNKKKAEQSQI